MSVFLIIFFFFFNDTATTEIYTLSLHDALPISVVEQAGSDAGQDLDLLGLLEEEYGAGATQRVVRDLDLGVVSLDRKSTRLNSSHGYISYAVFCLKKKKKTKKQYKKVIFAQISH